MLLCQGGGRIQYHKQRCQPLARHLEQMVEDMHRCRSPTRFSPSDYPASKQGEQSNAGHAVLLAMEVPPGTRGLASGFEP
eukprot:10182156-Alexandrium_andersonii.AAC.1